MTRLPRLTARKVLATLLRAGFYVHHQTGSHINLRHRTKSHLHIVVPRHHSDVSLKTLQSIIAQAELTTEEFKRMM